MDAIYALPYTRRPHPSYTEPIPAFDMIKDSVTIMRGCFGGCTFCSITTHQGRIIQSRSKESVLSEVREMFRVLRPGGTGEHHASVGGRQYQRGVLGRPSVRVSEERGHRQRENQQGARQ